MVAPVPALAARSPARIVRAEPPADIPRATAREVAPLLEVQPTPPAERTARFSFEDVFGRKLPIWAGGVTLAVCGFLIVKYSIDAGLLSPWVRVAGGLLFGAGLIAGAEAALRNEERVRDARVRQALAGAGVATLYGAILVAANLYGLVGATAAFVGLAAVTLLAGGLAVRFGAPSAVLGLVGGLAAPALVGAGEPNVPLLAFYLALTVGGLAALGRGQRWPWLGVAALTGGFGWGLLLIFAGALDARASASVAAYLLLLGVVLPVLLFESARGTIVRLAGALAAVAQLALLVATGGFSLLNWGLFGLVGAAVVWLSRREARLADLPAPALGVALLLLVIWPDPSTRDLALVIGGTAAIFGGPALWRLWRADGRLSDAAAIGAIGIGIIAVPLLQRPELSSTITTALALLGSAATAAAAAQGWAVTQRRDDARFALLVSTSAALLAAAAALALPVWTIAPAWALVAAGLLLFVAKAEDARLLPTAWGVLVLVAPALLLSHTGGQPPVAKALGWQDGLGLIEALRWAVPAAVAALFASRSGHLQLGRAAAAAATLLAYVALAQLLPTALLPLIPAAGLAALGWWRGAGAATLTAVVLSAAWAVEPLLSWLAQGVAALAGEPMLVNALPSPAHAVTHLLVPALAIGVLLWRGVPEQARRYVAWTSALLATVSIHLLWKQVFAIDTADRFVRLGLAERTAWEALLALLAFAGRDRLPIVTRWLLAAALAHWAWFTLVLHDPLWSEQAVGAWPVANLLLPTYALGSALLWAAGRLPLPPLAERVRQVALMITIILFAASELRQLLHGSLLVQGDVGQAEDIARSIVAIALAVGFLQWGIRSQQRDWRIGSLLLMLAAVAKVFLFDTSGLDGLLRIASFAALGFSLIGIGWLYSRYLPADVSRA